MNQFVQIQVRSLHLHYCGWVIAKAASRMVTKEIASWKHLGQPALQDKNRQWNALNTSKVSLLTEMPERLHWERSKHNLKAQLGSFKWPQRCSALAARCEKLSLYAFCVIWGHFIQSSALEAAESCGSRCHSVYSRQQRKRELRGIKFTVTELQQRGGVVERAVAGKAVLHSGEGTPLSSLLLSFFSLAGSPPPLSSLHAGPGSACCCQLPWQPLHSEARELRLLFMSFFLSWSFHSTKNIIQGISKGCLKYVLFKVLFLFSSVSFSHCCTPPWWNLDKKAA